MCLFSILVMDREWIYKMSRLDLAYIEHLTKFTSTVKSHCLSLKQELTICPCKSYKNLYAYRDDTVKSHLV